MDSTPNTPIERALKQLGGLHALAASVGVTKQAVWAWKQKGTVPAERVLAIEAATEGMVSRHELRPDLYPV